MFSLSFIAPSIKLRALNKLRKRNLDDWTCINILDIDSVLVRWYKQHLLKYSAEILGISNPSSKIPFHDHLTENLSEHFDQLKKVERFSVELFNKSYNRQLRLERVLFLKYLRNQVKLGKA